MVEVSQQQSVTGNSAFLTEAPIGNMAASGGQQTRDLAELTAEFSNEELSSDEDGDQNKNQYFQVDDAEPPTNYDDPYSTLPGKINLKNIKKDIISSMTFTQGEEDIRGEFKNVIEMEHFDALISDGFWYFICSRFKKDKEKDAYVAHNEFLLDRMAANYVSYTLLDDPKRISVKVKEKFFEQFYNHLSQAIYHCLKAAFPKNRNRIEKAETKRDLLNTFSYLFTGMVIQSAKYSKWTDGQTGKNQSGAAGHGAADKKKNETEEEISLADFARKQPPKTKRMKVPMKYSPLVDRYLFTHKYETKNNVRSWKMLITQRTEAANQADRKLKAYTQILKQVETKLKRSNEEYQRKILEAKREIEEDDKNARDHINILKQTAADLKRNGDGGEKANLVTSVFQNRRENDDNN